MLEVSKTEKENGRIAVAFIRGKWTFIRPPKKFICSKESVIVLRTKKNILTTIIDKNRILVNLLGDQMSGRIYS